MNEKIYNVSKVKQLVDLNGDTTNFELKFQVSSKNNCEFETLVVDQTTLDSNPNLEYKKAQGTISGTIVADKNVYQNYFLVLRSDKPCECVVKIDKKEIPPNQNINNNSNTSDKVSKQVNPSKPSQVNPHNSLAIRNNKEPEKHNWQWIFISIGIVGVCLVAWYLFKKSKKVSKEPKYLFPTYNFADNDYLRSPEPSAAPSVVSSKDSGADLLEKLKQLPE